MPNLFLRLLPLLALLGGLAGHGWLDDCSSRSDEGLSVAVAANGMIIDPDGKSGTPVVIPEPADPDL
jgi:hypothetical protein